MLGRGVIGRAAAALTLGLALAAAAPAAGQVPTRYSLAGGCYSLMDAASGTPAPGGEALRLQATTLGSYLLYTRAGNVLAAQGNGSVAPEQRASPAADWRVSEAGPGRFTLSPESSPDSRLGLGPGGLTVAGQAAEFSFAPASGCAVYPEAELSASGTPAKGSTFYGTVGGLLEGHMHWMTFEYLGGEFHCGRPWHRYGIPYALHDCSEIEGPQGLAAPVQNFLNFGLPATPHDTTGWPKLTEWRADNLTYEGTYWRWIERAWLGGLRLMVMSINENRILCELIPRKRTNCDEMDTVRRGFEDLRELQRYVDAQAGGPGKGFFEIVTTPYEARRVINEGRMAVVLEIEVSELFGCHGWEQPSCDRAQVGRQLEEFYRLGVRSSLLLNKFDNPLTGVRFDGGPIGTLINAANRSSAGSFWSAKTCSGPYRDNTIETFAPPGSAFLDSLLGTLGVTSGSLPAYPPAPHCNTRGLTDLGRYLVRRMMEKGMVVNPDHMSQKAVDETLTLAEANDYSGVISPHGWMDPGNWPRIWKLGGLAFPSSGTAPGYVEDYEKFRPERTPRLFGWGYGADLGGLAGQPAASDGVAYPFKSYDGKVTFERQRTGERTFDYTREGVAHYGLYPDWFADLRGRGGERLARDMWNGAEAYLQMWERADGIQAPACRPSGRRLTARGLGPIRLRSSWEALLRRAGQPQQRTRAWSWCVRGKRNRRTADVAVLSPSGRVELVGSTARRRVARGIAVGAPARRLRALPRRKLRRLRGGLLVRRGGRVVYVYFARRGRVRAVAVATRALARRPARLRAAMRRVRRVRASQAPPSFVPNPKTRSARITGTNLSGSPDPRLNQALRLLCQVNR